MTESEWLASTDPQRMLEFLRDRASDRKLRLFVCACCRRIWRLLTYDGSTRGVEVAELYAEGEVTAKEMARRVSPELLSTHKLAGPGRDAAYAAALSSVAYSTPDNVTAAHAHLLRDIFVNPFRLVSLDPAWRTSTVTALATAAYEERQPPAGHLDPDRLAVLADALEDAGCDNPDILSHLRGPGPHVRGCWVVDWILKKE